MSELLNAFTGCRVALQVDDTGIEDSSFRRTIVAERDLQGFRVAILAGAKTTLIAPHPGKIQAMKHDERTNQYPVDSTLGKAKPEDFDAILLPGGALNADFLRAEAAAQDFVRAIDEAGKPIAVICHAPWLLVSAGLVKGHTLTSYRTIQDDIRNAGGQWVDDEVVRDDKWVSSRQPSDIPAFNREMIELFAGSKQQDRSAA
jgi:protease I